MIPVDDLRVLEGRVQRALGTTTTGELRILGCGEISLVLGWPSGDPRYAVKRLPLFSDRSAFERYHAVFTRNLALLSAAGIDVLETELLSVNVDAGGVSGYCVQPVLPSAELAPRILAAQPPQPDHPVVVDIVEAARRAVCAGAGLDAQLSNWAWRDARLRYLDVTTPLLRDRTGTTEVDPSIFLAAYPWLTRPILRRFVLPSLVARYHNLRTVLLDLCANLHKERLAQWIPAFLTTANRHLDEPLSEVEVERDYRSDARLWALMLALRRADRFWQRRVRRRTYPFLLPSGIAR